MKTKYYNDIKFTTLVRMVFGLPYCPLDRIDVVEKSNEMSKELDTSMVPPSRPKSFKSRVNEYDTDEIPSLDDTSIVVQPAKRGRREYNNLDQSSIITTSSRLRSSKKKKS